jgi:hypothetical protein
MLAKLQNEILKGRDRLEDVAVDRKILLIYVNVLNWSVMEKNGFNSPIGLAVGFFGHGNELSMCNKCRKYLDHLEDTITFRGRSWSAYIVEWYICDRFKKIKVGAVFM